MSLNIDNFPFCDWGLRIGRLEAENGDMDLILWQGDCPNCGDDCFVRLSPCHFQPLARELGFLTAQEAAQGVERLQDRLTLLAALVRAHSPANSPLRTAVDALFANPSETVPEPLETPAPPTRSAEADPACGDLFDKSQAPCTALKNQEQITNE